MSDEKLPTAITIINSDEIAWDIPKSASENFRTFKRGEPITIVDFVDTAEGTDGLTEDGKIIPLYQEMGCLCTKEFDEEGHLIFFAPVIQNIKFTR